MSAAEVQDDKSEALPVPYKVGYGRPPAEHRFRKGHSGNPRGRPRGARNKPKIDTGLGMRGAEAYLRAEAYRMVTLREGDNVIELPAIQAVFRAMGVAAMKGNRFAQRALADMITRVEHEDFTSRLDAFGKWAEYKYEWGEAIERARLAGREPPRPIPHPDDVLLDPHTGDVKFAGPLTKEARDRLDHALARRAEAQDNVNYYADQYEQLSDDDPLKPRYLDDWHWEQRMFNIINDAVSERYKVKLENRSYKQGASQSGKALEELRANRKLRNEYVE